MNRIMNNDLSETFRSGCEMMRGFEIIVDFYNTEGIIADSEKLLDLSDRCTEFSDTLHAALQGLDDPISRLCFLELERQFVSGSIYLTRRAKNKWPTLDEYLETCYLTRADFDWLEGWLEDNITHVRPAYERLFTSHVADSVNDYLGCDVLHADWVRAVDQEVKATLEALSRILNESIEFKDVRIVLDFSYGTSHSRFKHGIVVLNAKKICGITREKGIIKQAEFLLEFAHELGHYVNTVYSTASSNPYVSDLSTFRSHANGVVMEVIADAFTDRAVELLINDEQYVETLQGSSDRDAITQYIHDTKLSRDYLQRLRAFTILMLAQKPKREFGSIAERITQLSLDSTYVETFIGNSTTYWLDDGTPPPEMLQLLRYHAGVTQKITDNIRLSKDNSSWLTGFWTPSGYLEW